MTDPIVGDGLGKIKLDRTGIEWVAFYPWVELGGQVLYTGLSSRRIQQNQFGTTERGTGMSLRFYEVASKAQISVVAFGGIRIPLTRRNVAHAVALAIGGEYDPLGTAIHFRGGWDRFGRDETWRTMKAARIRHSGVYARVDVALDEDYVWFFAKAIRARREISVDRQFSGLAITGDPTPTVLSAGMRFAF